MEMLKESKEIIWKNFARENWEKNPIVLKDMSNLSNPKEAFQILIDVKNALLEQQDSQVLVKLYVNGKQIVDNLKELLPNENDLDLASYEQRLVKEADAESFIFYATGIETVVPEIYLRLHSLVKNVFNQVGLPLGHAELELFFGKYQLTPGGVHNETCTNLHSVIYGEKVMRTWPETAFDLKERDGYVQIDPHTGEKEQFLNDIQNKDLETAEPLKGQANDIIYWPTGAWHVGESIDPSLSLNIAIYTKRNLSEVEKTNYYKVANTVSKLLIQSMNQDHVLKEYPLYIEDSVGFIELKYSEVKEYLSHLTNYGLRNLIEKRKQLLESNLSYTLKSNPIVYILMDSKLIYSVNGHVNEVTYCESFIELIDELNNGSHLTPLELSSKENELLQELYEIFAIEPA